MSEINFGTLVHLAAEHGFGGAVRKFFYNTRSFGMEGRAGYVPLTGESAVRQHLAKLGVPRSAHDSILCDIRETQFVDYIGPLAGHPAQSLDRQTHHRGDPATHCLDFW